MDVLVPSFEASIPTVTCVSSGKMPGIEISI
jgi:hypothetical protein